ncbi:MAG: glycosyltransferase family 4 protein [Christensenellaceae bacterium]
MKVLLIDNVTDGHHLVYANALKASSAYEAKLVLPDASADLIIGKHDLSGLHIGEYLAFVKEIRAIVRAERPDVVHFLNANVLVNYCGLGLGWLKGYKAVFTHHLHFTGKLKTIGLKRLARLGTAVVHTSVLEQAFAAYGGPVRHIEYPDFLFEEVEERPKGRKLLALGQTRYDKGADLLIEALKGVDIEYSLLIAGAPVDFTEADLRERAKELGEKASFDLRYLPEETMKRYLKEADVIVLPYRKVFDGASGPLTEGVGYRKLIVAPDFGSLGEIVRSRHIGYTFTCEDVGSLRDVLIRSLTEPFVYDETALAYRQFLSPERFRREYAELYEAL